MSFLQISLIPRPSYFFYLKSTQKYTNTESEVKDMAKWNETPRDVTLTIRITQEQKQELMELAKKNNVRVSFLAYDIIKQYLEANQ